jgi:hypothetical protein
VAGSCEYDDEPSGSVKCREFRDLLNECAILRTVLSGVD